MAKSNTVQKNIEKNNDIDFNIDNENFELIEFKEEFCPILWKKVHSFAFDFQNYGISVHVQNEHMLDMDKIKDIIRIKYKGQIGTSSFEYHPIYE